MNQTPDPGTEYIVEFNSLTVLMFRVRVALIDGKPHRAFDEGDDFGVVWKPCSQMFYDAIEIESMSKPH